MDKLNTYEAFPLAGKSIIVKAATSFAAQTEAAKLLRVRRPWQVTVVLVERADGTEVTHAPQDITP